MQGPAVTEIFRLRVLERLGYRQIAARLDREPVTYPAPIANRAGVSVGHWTVQAVRGILENPKYTGYQVWNRRARKGGGNKANPVSEWEWSPRPVHEPLVRREVFDTAWAGRGSRKGSRDGVALNAHPDTRRTYKLRSYVHCGVCERRMTGKTSKGLSSYVCYKDEARRSTADWFDQHPKALWVSEKILVEAVHQFFGDRVFGPQRSWHLQAQLAATHPDHTSETGKADPAGRLREKIKQIERQQERLLDQLAGEDHGDPETTKRFRQGIRERFDRLDRERRARLADAEKHRPAPGPTAQNPGLLDTLPQLGTRLADIPDALQRTVYDAFQLKVRYLRPCREIEIQVTVSAATADDLARLTTQTLTAGADGTGVDQPCFVCPRQGTRQMGTVADHGLWGHGSRLSPVCTGDLAPGC
ncbi:recombinase family protein [Streptomyces sp. N2-109]|uniref:Recombinase family protein n=1 Tax=Streptomyces gossypii TaxID=2883101 RepID=A0ABT2JTF2_9ACTN|nr:recombinase family protein [Streptomyces gossypii]MCT2590544.1 recombinase family protein [Streptomyces gossypii]